MVQSVGFAGQQLQRLQLLARSAHESAVWQQSQASLRSTRSDYSRQKSTVAEAAKTLGWHTSNDPHADDTRADSYEKQSTYHTGRSKLRQNPSAISQNLKRTAAELIQNTRGQRQKRFSRVQTAAHATPPSENPATGQRPRTDNT